MAVVRESMGTVALELTTLAVHHEEALAGYVRERVTDMPVEDVIELVTMLAAMSAGTYEAWADDTGQDVRSMLARAGQYMATTPEPDDD